MFRDTVSVAGGSTNGCTLCGARTFTLVALTSDTNYLLAETALTENVVWTSISSNSMSIKVKAQAFDLKYSGVTLVYTLNIALHLIPSK